MKVKLKTPDRVLVGFNRREMVLITNCLYEACHGILMDRFIPARGELVDMLDTVQSIEQAEEFYKVNSAAI